MKLADIVGGEVVIHADLLLMPFFKELWESDKNDKGLATKYISYIILKNHPRSPYVQSLRQTDLETKLKERFFKDPEYKLPVEVTIAESEFVSWQDTLAKRLLRGLRRKLEDEADYYQNSCGEELDLKMIKDLNDGATKVAGLLKSIAELEKMVDLEEMNNLRIRGGGELNPMEIPK